MSALADMVVKIRADTSGLSSAKATAKKDLSDIGGSADASKSKLASIGGAILGVVAGAGLITGAVAGFTFLKDQLSDVMRAGEDAQNSQAALNAVLKSTNGVAGVSASAVNDYADAMSKVTTYSADTITQSETMMLRFTGIGKSVFPQAQTAALDLASAMNIGPVAASRLLGKALNDPVKGMAQLTRVGVTLTDAQQKQVKAFEKVGNIAGAQGVILDVLKQKFSGTAQAAGSTFAGQMAIAQNQLELTKEKIGGALIPVLQEFAGDAMPLVTGAAGGFADILAKLAAFVVSNIIPAIHTFSPVVKQIATDIGQLVGIIGTAFQPAIAAIGDAFKKSSGPTLTAKDAMRDVKTAMTDAVPVVRAIAQGIAQLIIHLAPLIPAASNAVSQIGKVGDVVRGVVAWFDEWGPKIGAVAGIITAIFLPALIQTGVAALTTATTTTVSLIPSLITMAGTMATAAIGGIASAITGLVGYATAGWAAAAATIAATWPILAIIAAIALLVVGIYLLVTHWKEVSAWLEGAWAATTAAVGAGFSWIGTQAHNLWNTITSAFTAGVNWVIDKFTALGQFELNIWNGMVNTARTFWHLLVVGIQIEILWVENFLRGAWNGLTSFLSNVWNGYIGLVRTVWGDIGNAIHNAVTGIINGAEAWGRSLVQNLINGIRGMAGSLAGAAKSVIGGALSSIPLVGKLLPHFAAGGMMSAAGLAVVGEHGPELVQLPAGAQVYSNTQSANMVTGGGYSGSGVTAATAGAVSGSGASGGSGGYQAANIYLQLDGRTLAQALGQPLVDVIRVKTGLKI